MQFFTPKTNYTHRGSFYGIPVYLRDVYTDDDEPTVEGTNLIFDKLLIVMSYIHLYIIEPCQVFWNWLLGVEYEEGFPFMIKEEFDDVKD